MRLIKELIESLKMELKMLKLYDAELKSQAPGCNSPRFHVDINTKEEKIVPVVRSLFESSSYRVNSENIAIENAVKNGVKTGSFTARIRKQPILESLVRLNTVELAKSTNCANGKLIAQVPIESESAVFTISVREKIPRPLKIAKFKPAAPKKDEAFYRAVEKVLTRCRNKNLKYVGYYPQVPIHSAKKMAIIKNELIVELGTNSGSWCGVVVFRSGDDYFLETVE